MAECRSCNREIEWVVVEKSGKKMPIDAQPVADGNIVKLGSQDGESGLNLVVYDKPMPGGAELPEQGDRAAFPEIGIARPGRRERFKSHFATCPNADEHRR